MTVRLDRNEVVSFCRDIAAWALPERVAPLLAPGLAVETAARLLQTPALVIPCSAWLARVLEPLDGIDALEEDEQRLVLADGAALERAMLLSGAVWHARRVCGLVLAADISAFIAAHGKAPRDAAVQHLSLAPPPEEVDETKEADIGVLMTADGRACLAAWIDHLPSPIAGRVLMKLPREQDRSPRPPHRRYGPSIVRAVARAAGDIEAW